MEAKATERAQHRDLKGLRAIGEEKGIGRTILVCRGPRPRRVDGMEIMSRERFLDLLWNGRIHRG